MSLCDQAVLLVVQQKQALVLFSQSVHLQHQLLVVVLVSKQERREEEKVSAGRGAGRSIRAGRAPPPSTGPSLTNKSLSWAVYGHRATRHLRRVRKRRRVVGIPPATTTHLWDARSRDFGVVTGRGDLGAARSRPVHRVPGLTPFARPGHRLGRTIRFWNTTGLLKLLCSGGSTLVTYSCTFATKRRTRGGYWVESRRLWLVGRSLSTIGAPHPLTARSRGLGVCL